MANQEPNNLRPLPNSKLSYRKALELVMGLADFERSKFSPTNSAFHLERMHLLMERLGNPHLGIPTLHVAGTKGKGSTAAMITSILRATGLKVGLYTSPHLHSAVERIRIGFDPISQSDFANLVGKAWPAAQNVTQLARFGSITTFEFITSMAFLHFMANKVDYQVIEVGLGGRLDATNIVNPSISIITSISLDHTHTLGTSIKRIATEKAGIIKPEVPVIVAPQSEEAMSVFRKVSKALNAPLIEVTEQISWNKTKSDLHGQSFDLACDDRLSGKKYALTIPLLGDYQLENAGTALASIKVLDPESSIVSDNNIIQGLNEVAWPGRFEILKSNKCKFVVDGAHNPYSLRKFVLAICEYFRFNRVITIFGTLGGHSTEEMLLELGALDPVIILTQSRHPRANSIKNLFRTAMQQGLSVEALFDNVGEATRMALNLAKEDDLIIGTGSLSVVAEVIEEVKGIPPELYPLFKGTAFR